MSILISTLVDTARAAIILTVENTASTPVTVTVARSIGVAGNLTVRGLVNLPLTAGQVKQITDGEPILGAPFTYSALIAGATVTTTPPVTVPTDTIVVGGAAYGWLKHPWVETLSVPILVQSLDSINRPSVTNTFLPYGAALPVVSTLKRQARVGAITLLTLSESTREALIDSIRDGNPMQFVFRPEFGVTRGGFYASITDFTEERVNPEVGEDSVRRFTIQWVEVAAPALNTPTIPADQFIYTDLKIVFPTYQKLFDDRLKGTTYRTLLTYPAIP
jgi:hypothetical protein